jgi:6-phosphofructokinase
MGAGGECPTCNRVIAARAKTPWHFKVLLASLIVYLTFRGYQGVEWLVTHI